MEKEFISYEEALALKELGFDEQCFATYNSDKKVNRNPSHNMEDLPIEGQPYYWNNSKIYKSCITTPLYQQAFRWFREKYKLDPTIKSWTENNKIIYYISTEPIGKPSRYKCYEVKKDSYEEAELACLKKLIEIVKNKL